MRVVLPLLFAFASAGKPVVVNNGAICENKATGFFVVDNTVLSLADSIVYKDYSEDECLKTCAQNRDLLGRSILCSSFAYHHESFSCTIYKDKAKPEGEAKTEAAVGKRYFEKVCLNDAVPIQCADAQFIRVDNSELVGYAVEVTMTETLEECVAHCSSNSTCRSAMYFYEENECIMSTESALSKPNDFKKAQDDDKVIYFQNGCSDMQRVQVEPITPVPQASQEKVASQEMNVSEEKKASHEKKEQKEVIEDSEEKEEKEEEEKEEKVVEEAPKSAEKPVEKSTEQTEVTTQGARILASSAETEVTPNKSIEETAHTDDAEDGKKHTSTHKKDKASPEDQEYDDEGSLEKEEAELEKERRTVEKLAQKAGYVKYKDHPRNFASRTLKASDDEETVDKVEGDHHKEEPAHDSNEDEEVEHVSKEEAEEPTEAATKPIKKKGYKKDSKKVAKVKSSSAEELEAQTFTSYFSEWSDWTACEKSGERQIRRRKCLDLRKCLGALMQVRNCPAVVPTPSPEDPIESVRSLIAVPSVDYDETEVRAPVAVVRPRNGGPLLPASDVPASVPESIWSPWQGTCQQFASGQPCNDGQMIGFESRECAAKDPSYCEGPFFRYCTLAC